MDETYLMEHGDDCDEVITQQQQLDTLNERLRTLSITLDDLEFRN
jgi:hypothetical protein